MGIEKLIWPGVGGRGILLSTRFHCCPQPSRLKPSSSLQFFALFLCCFWNQMPKGFLTAVFSLPCAIRPGGIRVTFVSKESHNFPGKTNSQLFPVGFPSILILNIWLFKYLVLKGRGWRLFYKIHHTPVCLFHSIFFISTLQSESSKKHLHF